VCYDQTTLKKDLYVCGWKLQVWPLTILISSFMTVKTGIYEFLLFHSLDYSKDGKDDNENGQISL